MTSFVVALLFVCLGAVEVIFPLIPRAPVSVAIKAAGA